jgi:hypothetical protein
MSLLQNAWDILDIKIIYLRVPHPALDAAGWGTSCGILHKASILISYFVRSLLSFWLSSYRPITSLNSPLSSGTN